MTYAQKDYNDIQGNNGVNTIAEIGSLLTAFSNLLERLGEGTDPATLNLSFIEDNVYLNKTDEVRDRLALSSISAYDSTIGITGVGEGLPLSSDAIVKLDYHSMLTGGQVSTYALVADAQAGTIIDSFDGLEKSWDIYGGPVEWYSYKQYDAITIMPLKAVVQPAKETPDTYTVYHSLRGYTELLDAEASTNSNIDVHVGEYIVYDVSDDAKFINITATPDQPGAWIAAADNVRDIDVPLASNDGERIEVKIVADPLAWQKTYTPYLNVIEMVVVNDSTIHDVSGELASQDIHAGDSVPVAGEFTHNMITYARTKTSVDNKRWYGIAISNLRRDDPDDEALDRALDHYLNSDDDELHFELGDDKLSTREKAIKFGATVDGKIEKVSKALSFGKNK